jgi:septal ring factor EnvC (AmiA/AmiB activator)
MNPDFLVPLAAIAIVMVGLVKIARYWASGSQRGASSATQQLESRVDAMEQELATLQQDLIETQERLDFAERVLAQSRDAKRLEGSP